MRAPANIRTHWVPQTSKGFVVNTTPTRTAADFDRLSSTTDSGSARARILRIFCTIVVADNGTDFANSPNFGLLDQYIDACATRGVSVVIVMTILGSANGSYSGAGAPNSPVWGATGDGDTLRRKIADYWGSIAQYYRVTSPVRGASIFGFELLNEPYPSNTNFSTGKELWERWCRLIVKEIRQNDPSRVVIYSSTPEQRVLAFDQNPPSVGYPEIHTNPYIVDRMFYAIHFYEPFFMTHQGTNNSAFPAAGTVEYPTADPGGLYPYGTLQPLAPFTTVPQEGNGWRIGTLRRILAPVQRWSRTWDVPIIVTEFSAARWAPTQSSAQSSPPFKESDTAWVEDCIALFTEFGWAWCYHEFRSADVWDAEFSYTNLVTLPNGSVRDANAPTWVALRNAIQS